MKAEAGPPVKAHPRPNYLKSCVAVLGTVGRDPTPTTEMSGKPTIGELVAVNLRYDGGTALNVRAVGQLLAKILFASGTVVSKSSRRDETVN
jgi:hypothetical protein